MGFSPECLRTVGCELFLLATVDDELGEKSQLRRDCMRTSPPAVGAMLTWPCV